MAINNSANNTINNAEKSSNDSKINKAGKSLSKKNRSSHDSADVPEKGHQEEVLDEALEESFPASDPVAVNITKK